LSIKSWNIVLVVALLAVLAIGGAFLYKSGTGRSSEAAKEQEAQVAVREQVAKKRYEAKKVLYSEFEAALNGFIQELDQEARAYKALRKVYMDLIVPVNLRAPEFVVENHNIGVRTNMELQLQMEKIISMFTNTDAKMRNLISRLPDDEAERASAQWKSLQDEQAEMYLQFFTADQDIFAKVQQLLGFYYAHRADMSIDVARNSVDFATPENQATALAYQKEIDVLKQAQAAMMRAERS